MIINQGENCPTMCVISKYLLEDNMYTLAYLESQKFGNLQLNEAAHKKAASFNFTTRAVHYGPDYIGHIRNLELARPHEREASKYTWTENRRQEPGHRRPQDQALEARMNKAVKHNFKVGTAENVINRSATIKLREKATSRLKQELGIKSYLKAESHKMNFEALTTLRGLWRKVFNNLMDTCISTADIDNIDGQSAVKEITALHNNK